MKIVTIIVRVLIGLLLLFASVSYFYMYFTDSFPKPEMSEDLKMFMDGLEASKYLMPLVKALELLCGLAFVSGKFVKLANIVILPITVNILLVHIFLDPASIPAALFLFLGNLFLIYRNWDSYKNIVTP